MLFENPFFIVFFGLIATAIPLFLWVNVGGNKLLFGTLGCLLFFSTWLFVERTVETDREALKRTIYEFRDLLREDKVDELLKRVEPSALPSAHGELKQFKFLDCGVSNLSNSPTFYQRDGETFGEIQFVGSATVDKPPGRIGPLKLKLEFRKAGEGDWRVVDYYYKLLGDNRDEWTKQVRY